MSRHFNRRIFLKLTGMSLALSLADPLLARIGGRQRVSEALLQRARSRTWGSQTQTPTLVNIFLRGGADGLNMVVPTESGEYTTYLGYRPGLGVDIADMQNAPESTVLTDATGADLQWGLHPRMYELMELWNQESLVIMPDAHYAQGSRSHFDSQQFYENGTPWNKLTPSGWANRWLQLTDPGDPLLRAISFDNQTPFTMQGDYPTLTFSNLNDLSVSGNASRNARYLDTQEQAYPLTAGGPDRYAEDVAVGGSSLINAIRAIEAADLPPTDPNANYPDETYVQGRYTYFGDRLKDLARLIKSDVFKIEMATVDLYGWDTHNLQDSAYHNHPNLVQALSRGIRAFWDDLGATFQGNVVIAVFSEFGRTSRENGSAGTDHGSATASFVVGAPGKVNGRRVLHGPSGWYGLDDLRDDRDLKYSVDFRDILAEILQGHMGFYDDSIFPGYTPLDVGILR